MAKLAPAVALDRILTLAEFEPLARERMAGPAYDYVAGGAWDEITLAENEAAWRTLRFVPRVLTDVRHIEPSGSFLGRRTTLPIAVAPMAAQELAHPDAELEAMRGAAASEIPYCLSTSSSRTIEEVAAVAPGAERWFQLYLVDSLEYSRTLVERAEASGYRLLVVTVDLPLLGYRERDRRSGFSLPPMPHVDAPAGARESRYRGLDSQAALGLTWATIERIRGWTSLPVVLKGILSPDDARIAAESGIAGICVSNHGARQLDRSIATANALEPIVDAVAGRTEVWVDGGIRRGLDVVAALCLGATGVLVGRPYYWALAVAGAAGVKRVTAILREEIGIALAILGSASLGALDRGLIAGR